MFYNHECHSLRYKYPYSNRIDHEHQRPVVHRRGGQSIPEKRSPTKQVNQISLKYQTQSYQKNQEHNPRRGNGVNLPPQGSHHQGNSIRDMPSKGGLPS